MEPGNVVEYIDHQKIVCAVVMEVKKQKLRLLTETNREVKLSAGRLLHKCKTSLGLSMGRNKLVEALKEAVDRRKALMSHINIKELWETLNTEQKWIDLSTMTELCFPNGHTCDHESAVARAFFKNRLYFKFNNDHFFPNSEEQVKQSIAQAKEAARKDQIVEEGGVWLKKILSDNDPSLPLEFVELLKSFYLFGKESRNHALSRAMLAKAGIRDSEAVFLLLVKLGVWNKDENIELYRYKIPVPFSNVVMERAAGIVDPPQTVSIENRRKDLTMLSAITIDGESTTDYDDALSIEDKGDHYCLGVHIADIGHFIKKGDAVDKEAVFRGTSIYMADQRVPMIPSCLAEDLCSLKAGELRPAISIMVRLSLPAEIIDYEVIPSLIRVKERLTYYNVNMVASKRRDIIVLHDIAEKFRQMRINHGAVQISLPEINIWIDKDGRPAVNRINRDSPGRMLVSEIMIMANWLMARFLAKHNLPAIYRSQPEPRERLYGMDGGTLFQNLMQQRLLCRFVLGCEPEHHSGLGLDAYVTATSPIRRYFDLATQRQIRAIFGLEEPYTREEIKRIIQSLEQPLSCASKVQYNRNRYWLLKYLEGKVGQKEDAIVLYKRRNSYQVLIPGYMIECDLPLSSGIDLNPSDLIQITIQHVDARRNVFSVFMG